MVFDRISPLFMQKISDAACRYALQLGYSPQMIAWGFRHMASHWTEAEFRRLCEGELPHISDAYALVDGALPLEARCRIVGWEAPKTLLLVTASTVPSAAFQDVMLFLMMPLYVTLRPSTNQRMFFEEVKQIVSEFLPEFGARLSIGESAHDELTRRKLCENRDWISVSGADETIGLYEATVAALPEAVRPRCMMHGHRVSAICIPGDEMDAWDEAMIERMALDVSVWDQVGCLSPKCLFIEANQAAGAALARRLAAALDGVAEQLPGTAMDMHTRAAMNNALMMAQLDGAQVVCAPKNRDYLVIYPEHSQAMPLLFPRCLSIYPVSDAFEAAVQGLSPRGQALCSMHPEKGRERFEKAGFNYFCKPGQMQDPPLYWRHDGRGTWAPLVE